MKKYLLLFCSITFVVYSTRASSYQSVDVAVGRIEKLEGIEINKKNLIHCELRNLQFKRGSGEGSFIAIEIYSGRSLQYSLFLESSPGNENMASAYFLDHQLEKLTFDEFYSYSHLLGGSVISIALSADNKSLRFLASNKKLNSGRRWVSLAEEAVLTKARVIASGISAEYYCANPK